MGGGGGRLGIPEVGTRDPRHGLGGSYTRKNFFRPRSKYTHSGNNTQRSFDPPPPPQKRGTEVRGGGGVRRERLATPTPMPSMISGLSNSVRPCKVTGPCPCLAPPMSSSQRSPTPSLLCGPGARSCCPVRLGCNLLCYLGTRQWQCARLCPQRYTGFWLKLSGMCRAPSDGSFFCLTACLSRSSTQWVTCSRGCPDPPSGTGLLTPPGT